MKTITSEIARQQVQISYTVTAARGDEVEATIVIDHILINGGQYDAQEMMSEDTLSDIRGELAAMHNADGTESEYYSDSDL